MAEAAVRIEGLSDLRRQLNKLDKSWGRELAKVHRDIARWVEPKARAEAASIGGMTGHFANAIKGTGTQTGARLTNPKEANAGLWGTKQQTGWHAGWHKGTKRARAQNGPNNNPPWVGAAWTVGGAGGPYGMNAAVRDNLPEIRQMYLEAVDRWTRDAFPDGAPY